MKKNPAIILLSLITLFLMVFIFFPLPWINEDIPGCTDPIATNYYINANVDDSSCVYKGSLSYSLQNKVDQLINSTWNKVDFKNLRTEILSFHQSEGKQGSLNQQNTLSNLNSDYISVLYKETKKVSGKCFSKSSALKKEVSIFYKDYKNNNKEIRAAKRIFNTRDKIFSFQKKVRSLLKKEFEKNSFVLLLNDIDNFRNKSSYKSYIKPCKSLISDLDKCESDLRGFKDIHEYYNGAFKKLKLKNTIKWRKGITPFYKNQFKPYEWYYNQLK